jgi:hypothetical protein
MLGDAHQGVDAFREMRRRQTRTQDNEHVFINAKVSTSHASAISPLPRRVPREVLGGHSFAVGDEPRRVPAGRCTQTQDRVSAGLLAHRAAGECTGIGRLKWHAWTGSDATGHPLLST